MSQWNFTNYCKNHLKLDKEDLVKLAKNKNGFNILVDYQTFKISFIKMIIHRLVKKYNNENLYFFLAEYDFISESFYELQENFKAANINLIWVIGCDNTYEYLVKTDPKEFTTILERKHENKSKLYTDLEKNVSSDFYFPISQTEVLRYAIKGLKESGAEIIQILEDKMVIFMMKEYIHRNSFGIWTNNFEFCFIPRSKIIIIDQFDFDSLQKGSSKINWHIKHMFEKLNSFPCKIISYENIERSFQFDHPDQAIILGILSGIVERFTKQSKDLLFHLKQIEKVSLKKISIEKLSSYIKKEFSTLDNFINNGYVAEYLNNNPQFNDVIDYFRKFQSYENNVVSSSLDSQEDNGTLKSCIKIKLSNLSVDRSLLALHEGHYFDSRKDIYDFGEPSFEDLSFDIIKSIAPYVLDENVSKVTMWTVSGMKKEVDIPKVNVKINKIIPLPLSLSSNTNTVCGVDVFEKIWSHLENDNLQFFKKFGIELGFICYILRYLCRKCEGKNGDVNKISDRELKNLFCTIFYQYSKKRKELFIIDLNREFFLKQKICPTNNCVNLLKRFMHLFLLAKRYTGDALSITDLFPNADHVMASSVFYVFSEDEKLCEMQRDEVQKLKVEILNRYKNHYNAIIEDLKHSQL